MVGFLVSALVGVVVITALFSPKLWVAVAFGCLLLALGFQTMRVNHAHQRYASLEAKVEKDRADRAEAALEATNENQRIANRWNANLIGAVNESKLREQRLSADAVGASAELDRLRLAIRKATAVRSDVPSNPGKASPEPANPIGDVLGECAAEVQRLAGAADRHASDVQTLIDAWPH